MRIVIYGAGTVGRATGLILERAGLTSLFWDLLEDRRTCAWGDVLAADVLFLCLSRMKSVEDDSSVLSQEVKRLDALGYQGAYVQRTTCAPGTAETLCKDFALVRRYLCWPEFLREAHWEDDALHPDRVVLGVPNLGPLPTPADSVVALLHQIVAKVFPPGTPVHTLTCRQAELAKLVANAALALRVSWWNELATRFRGDVDDALVAAVAADHRLRSFGDVVFGAPWGGKCFSKDVSYLAGLVPGGVIAETQAVNERMGGIAFIPRPVEREQTLREED